MARSTARFPEVQVYDGTAQRVPPRGRNKKGRARAKRNFGPAVYASVDGLARDDPSLVFVRQNISNHDLVESLSGSVDCDPPFCYRSVDGMFLGFLTEFP